MRTPSHFTKNLEKGIITEEMLEMVLYSLNKRAKNYRDRKKKYYGINDRYGNLEKCEMKEDELYRKKDYLLKTILEPKHIHLLQKTKSIINRIYDYEVEYNDYAGGDYYENCYFDRELREEVWFVDVPQTITKNLYFLFYETSNYSFHIPINETDLERYADLAIKELDALVTTGKDINDLLSCQFCDKVFAVVKSNEFEFVR